MRATVRPLDAFHTHARAAEHLLMPEDEEIEAEAPADARLLSLLKEYDTSPLAKESDINTQMLNAMPDDVPKQRKALRLLKCSLNAEERKAKAEEYKALANERFKAGHQKVAISGYLAGIFMLRDAKTVDCPVMVATHMLGMDEVPSFLGGAVVRGETAEDATADLRTALQINVAAAALKLARGLRLISMSGDWAETLG